MFRVTGNGGRELCIALNTTAVCFIFLSRLRMSKLMHGANISCSVINSINYVSVRMPMADSPSVINECNSTSFGIKLRVLVNVAEQLFAFLLL